MVRKSICLSALLALGMVGSSFAQNLTDAAQAQVGTNPDASTGAAHSIDPQLIHSVPSELVADEATNTPNAIAGNPGAVPNVISVPNFTRSFTVNGMTFPYTMVGNDPSLGHITTIPTKILAVSLRLLNADGTVFDTVDATPFVQPTLNSPEFQRFKYEHDATSGIPAESTQFSDAVQRAEFFSSMDPNWHTELAPSVVDHITITVPKFVTVRFRGQNVQAINYQSGLAADGHRFVLMFNLFFNQQLGIIMNNGIDAGNFTTDAINLPLFPNTFLFSFNPNNPLQRGSCCVLGFHTYFTDGASPEHRWITNYASFISPGIFGGGFNDITAISHEIAETFNDPFVNNITPRWHFPGLTACQGNLETGDPVEVLANATFPVTLKNAGVETTYHPQTEALLQWFAQTVPSDAIHGAYSYPDLTALTAPASLCH
ncbi:MAG TPA: hypothetical protein VKV30_04845 [Candidatus Angelobacter sp.]|nr:hypothetical protein [Candidatus Angelobacter sp.]